MEQKNFGKVKIGQTFKVGLLVLRRVLTKEENGIKFNAVSVKHPSNTYYIPSTQTVNAVGN